MGIAYVQGMCLHSVGDVVGIYTKRSQYFRGGETIEKNRRICVNFSNAGLSNADYFGNMN